MLWSSFLYFNRTNPSPGPSVNCKFKNFVVFPFSSWYSFNTKRFDTNITKPVCIVLYTAIATAIPNGHLLVSGRSYEDGGEDDVDMPLVQPTPIRPPYPRTQYQSQYTTTSTPRVNAGDLSQPSSGNVRITTLNSNPV